LKNNTKSDGGKTHWTDPQNSDTTVPSGRQLYNLQFSLQAASPEAFGYTLLLTKYCKSYLWITRCAYIKWGRPTTRKATRYFQLKCDNLTL